MDIFEILIFQKNGSNNGGKCAFGKYIISPETVRKVWNVKISSEKSGMYKVNKRPMYDDGDQEEDIAITFDIGINQNDYTLKVNDGHIDLPNINDSNMKSVKSGDIISVLYCRNVVDESYALKFAVNGESLPTNYENIKLVWRLDGHYQLRIMCKGEYELELINE